MPFIFLIAIVIIGGAIGVALVWIVEAVFRRAEKHALNTSFLIQ